MTDSQIHAIGRSWLESKGLMHLLADPHTNAQIRGCVATYYPGGCKAFARDVTGRFEEVAPVMPPLRPRPAVQLVLTPEAEPSREWLEQLAADTRMAVA